MTRFNFYLTLSFIALTLQSCIASVVKRPREIFGKVRDFHSKYSAGKEVGDFIFIVGNFKWDIYSGRLIVGDV